MRGEDRKGKESGISAWHPAMTSLFVAWYNYCRCNSAGGKKIASAMAAGLMAPGLEYQGITGASGMNTTPTSATDSRTAGVNGNAAKRRDTAVETSSNRHYLWRDYRADNPAFFQPRCCKRLWRVVGVLDFFNFPLTLWLE
jgi:hypothetical protein